MNKTVSGMKTDAWELSKKHYTIKKRSDFNDKMAVEKASISDLSVALRSKGRPMRSVKFTYRKNKSLKNGESEHYGSSFRREERSNERGRDKGARKNGSGGWNRGRKPVFLHVLKSNSGGYVKSAFMANFTPGKNPAAGENSLSGIFSRTGGAKKRVESGRYKGILREPIKQHYSPGSVQMLKNDETQQLLQKKAIERFNKELDHQIEYLLDQQIG